MRLPAEARGWNTAEQARWLKLIGAGLRDGEEGAVSQQINLYSPIFRKQTKVFSATTMLQGLALIVLVVAVFYYYIAAQSSVLELRAARIQPAAEGRARAAEGVRRADSPAERAKALADARKKHWRPPWRASSRRLAASTPARRVRAQRRLLRGVARARARLGRRHLAHPHAVFREASGELSLAGRATRADLVPAYLERLRARPSAAEADFGQLECCVPAAGRPGAARRTPLRRIPAFLGAEGAQAK